MNGADSFLLIWLCFYGMFSVTILASYFITYKARFTDEILLYLMLVEAMKAPDFEQSKDDILGEATEMS